MESRMAVWALGLMIFSFLLGGENGGVVQGSKTCRFPAIFNFGDSNSDTGVSSAAVGEVLLPNGETVGHKFKRACDGRLIIDFIAENLGLPYLNSTLDSIGTSFRHGANFATAGSRISQVQLPGIVPFNLDVQVSQFLLFKSRAIAALKGSSEASPLLKGILPKRGVFKKALYTIDIGQNDLASQFDFKPISNVIDSFYRYVERLLKDGAKFLWVHNTGPFGCLPLFVGGFCKTNKPCTGADQNGCLKPLNDKAQEFNRQLKDAVDKLRSLYPRAVITYVDIYSAKYKLISNAKSQGFVDPFKHCCGNSQGGCGARVANGKEVRHERGKLTGTACNEPSKYVSWDGVHYGEAANRFVANLIVNGSFSEPPRPIARACYT